jgi:hypothetical protein
MVLQTQLLHHIHQNLRARLLATRVQNLFSLWFALRALRNWTLSLTALAAGMPGDIRRPQLWRKPFRFDLVRTEDPHIRWQRLVTGMRGMVN